MQAYIDSVKNLDNLVKDNPMYDAYSLITNATYVEPDKRRSSIEGFTYNRKDSDEIVAVYENQKTKETSNN